MSDYPLWTLPAPAKFTLVWNKGQTTELLVDSIYVHGSKNGAEVRVFEVQTGPLARDEAIELIRRMSKDLELPADKVAEFTTRLKADKDKQQFLNTKSDAAALSLGILKSFDQAKPVVLQCKVRWLAGETGN